MTSPAGIALIAHTPDHVRALMAGDHDYEKQFGIAVAEGVTEFFAGPEVSEGFLARTREAPAPDPWRDGFGVVHLAEQRLIGICGFNGRPDDEGAVEIAYGIAPGYTGRGYATAAVQLLIAHALIHSEVRQVRAHTMPQENASTRVLRKCGFQVHREFLDPVDGRIWRWEMARGDFTCQIDESSSSHRS